VWKNPNIFEYDYQRIKETKKDINEEIIMLFSHPNLLQASLADVDMSDIEDLNEHLNEFALQNIRLVLAVPALKLVGV
jgi:hypothetical protein